MKNTPLLLILALLVLSCGVKDRGILQEPVVPSGDLPSGLVATKEKKFLIRPSLNAFPVAEVPVTYRVVTNELVPLDSSVYSIQVKYWMPSMPDMPVTPAKIENLSSGEVKITYDISMSGPWEIELSIVKDGRVADTWIYLFEVQD